MLLHKPCYITCLYVIYHKTSKMLQGSWNHVIWNIENHTWSVSEPKTIHFIYRLHNKAEYFLSFQHVDVIWFNMHCLIHWMVEHHLYTHLDAAAVFLFVCLFFPPTFLTKFSCFKKKTMTKLTNKDGKIDVLLKKIML